MKKLKYIFLVFFIAVISTGLYVSLKKDPPLEDKFVVQERIPVSHNSNIFEDTSPSEDLERVVFEPVNINVPAKYEISKEDHTYQTFNNCGPATLSMVLSYYGLSVSQNDLGDNMRPYQNPEGDNDDKTIFTSEFVDWAKYYGENINLIGINLPNGDIELLKMFISQDIPVVAKAWLNNKEDIGHFVLIRGYDDTKQQLIKDDSYYGPDKKVSYFDFMGLWQAFNYNYVILYTPDQEIIVKTILGEEFDEKIAWQNSIDRALRESELDPDNVHPIFNLSVAYYHIGDFENSVIYYDRAKNNLPRRMLWYQIEPIKSYIALGKTQEAINIIDNILNDNNRAFSELYYLKGQIYQDQNKIDAARNQYQEALKYNQNYEPAKNALEEIN